MDTIDGLNTKTALEHLIYVSGQSIVAVCRDIRLTPQQFSDWIKRRRPIPADRLRQLGEYFGVAEDTLASEDRYARGLSALRAVELEMLVVSRRARQSAVPEERLELAYRAKMLQKEHQWQLRIARLSALLETDDPEITAKIDGFLDEMQARK